MKRFISVLLLGMLSLGLFANSPVNFGLNFRLNMPRAVYESTDWNQFFNDVSNVNSTNSYTDVIDNSQMGYAGGVFLRFNGKGKGFLHSEAMFSFNNTGMTSQDAVTGEDVTLSTESSVFNVPIYLGRNFINTPVFKLRVMTGPSLEWNINTTTTGHREGVDISGVENDVTYNDFNWYWGIGAGVELFMFSLDARYRFDIKGMTGSTELQNSFNQQTNMVEFTLGFKLF